MPRSSFPAASAWCRVCSSASPSAWPDSARPRSASVIDLTSIDFVYRVCSFLPLIGLLTAFAARRARECRWRATARWRLLGAFADDQGSLVDDLRAQRADRDLDLEHIARLHPQRRLAAMADAFGGAGRDHVAGDSAVKSEQKAMICGIE